MSGTKEQILRTALALFARDGYEAVSVSAIAGALGMTKGALYRHYASKRAIFESILARMEARDAEGARDAGLPEGPPDEQGYDPTTADQVIAYSKAQFRYWTEDPFAAPFRRMLTLEQYRSEEMARLYQNYLAAGPLDYVAELLRGRGLPRAQERAAAFYAPMFLLYSVYDGAEDKQAVTALLDECLEAARYLWKEGTTMDIIIRRETEQDHRAVEELTREAFWNVYRPGCLEHYVLHCYRTDPGFVPELSLVMEEDGVLIGHVMYARSELVADDGTRIPIMTFGPISIAPGLQGKGYGKRLLDRSMALAKEMGAKALAITGAIGFYGKSGFVVGSTRGVRYAFAEPDDAVVPYFLVKELEEGFLDGFHGTYRDPKPYFVADRDPEGFAAFDAQFPPKAKEKRPGQLV